MPAQSRAHLLLAALLILTAAGCTAAPRRQSGAADAAGTPVAAPAARQASIQIDQEWYTLPAGVSPADLVWTHTADQIIWAALQPGQPVQIRVTARRTGGGALADSARDLAALPETPAATGKIRRRLLRLTAAGDWLICAVRWEHTLDGQVEERLYAMHLTEPNGLVGVADQRFDADGRMRYALSDGLLVWQWYWPRPDGRFTVGETVVHDLATAGQWVLPGVGWASDLRIEGENLVATLLNGAVETRALRPKRATGERAVLAAGDMDGDARADEVIGIPGPGRGYNAITVRLADGRELPLTLPHAAEAPTPDTVPYAGAWLADLGGPTPVLLLFGTGGSMGDTLEAYAYSAGEQRWCSCAGASGWAKRGLPPWIPPHTRSLSPIG